MKSSTAIGVDAISFDSLAAAPDEVQEHLADLFTEIMITVSLPMGQMAALVAMSERATGQQRFAVAAAAQAGVRRVLDARAGATVLRGAISLATLEVATPGKRSDMVRLMPGEQGLWRGSRRRRTVHVAEPSRMAP